MTKPEDPRRGVRVIKLTDRQSMDVLDADIALDLLDGTYSHALAGSFPGVADVWTMVPEGGGVERSIREERFVCLLAAGTGWRASLTFHGAAEVVNVMVVADTTERADRVLALIAARAPEPPRDDDDEVRMTFWSAGQQPQLAIRMIEAPPWSEIARNYPRRVGSALARLVDLRAPGGTGRLLLWYGEPGTGKTTAIRSLAREWRSWADVHYVVDAEQLFGRADYLLEVIHRGRSDRWKLVVLEDVDHLLRADAGARGAGALGRLLNLSDGILGQGARLMTLITTNEPVAKLHPALVRPGRCLAEVEFSAFDRTEAAEWLQGHCEPGNGATLADLYRLAGESEMISARADLPRTGAYL